MFGIDDNRLPSVSARIELVKRFLELGDYTAALQVVQSIMASDDQHVEAWYLEGWCLYLMAEHAKETGQACPNVHSQSSPSRVLQSGPIEIGVLSCDRYQC